MAETLETIYLNTSIGGTELDDGEHTILTTDANTRYVIKDMYVNGSTGLDNTYLELNGFNVGSVASNASGSLIVGPNSTLKIKTTDFPISIYESREFAQLSDNSLLVTQSYKTTSGNTLSSSGLRSNSSVSSPEQTTDVIYTVDANGNPFAHYTTNDSNSSQVLYYYQPTASGSIGTGGGYNPFGITTTSLYGTAAFRFAGGTTFYYQDLVANPTSQSLSTTNFPNNGNTFSPYTTSSEPRGHAAHGYFFYIPSSGYTTNVFAINLTTGAFFRFNLNNGLYNTSYNFTVGYDPQRDKFIVYRRTSTTLVYYDIMGTTKTVMDATTGTGYNNIAYEQAGSITTETSASSGFGAYTMGHDINGNFTFKNSNGARVTLDISGNEVSRSTTLSFDGTDYTPSGTGPFVKRERFLSDTEVATLNLSLPSFGIQLLGVKSTNV